MISRLGSVAEIKRHCGWTGHVETSWKNVSTQSTSARNPTSKQLKEIDGRDSIFYWVDLTTEMAFYLPQQLAGQSIFFCFCSTSIDFCSDNSLNDLKIFIVWFEEFPNNIDSILPGL